MTKRAIFVVVKRFFLASWRVFRTLFLSLTLISLLAVWGLRLPFIQKWLVPKVETLLGSQLGTDVHIGAIRIDFPARIALSQVEIEDQNDQALFRVGDLRVSLADISFRKKRYGAGHVELIRPEAILYKSRIDSALNLDFLTASEDSSIAAPFNMILDFPDVRIRGGEFSFVDSTQSDEKLAVSKRLNTANIRTRNIDLDLSALIEPDVRISGKILRLSALDEVSELFLSHFSTGYELKLGKSAPGGLWACLDNTQLRAGRNKLDLDVGIFNDPRAQDSTALLPRYMVNFRSSTLDFTTLNRVLPKDLPMEDPVEINGLVYGFKDRIQADSLRLNLFNETELFTAVDLKHFLSGEDLVLDLDLFAGRVSFEELDRFLTTVDLPLAGVALMDGRIRLDGRQIRSPDLHFRYGKQTDVRLNARLYNYTDANELLMDFKLKNSKVQIAELRKLLKGVDLPEVLEKMGSAMVEGHFIGGTDDFVVDAAIKTPHGNTVSNLHLILPGKNGEIAYEGTLKTEEVDLDVFGLSGTTISKALNFDGKIKGRGVDFYTMTADIEGTLEGSQLLGYKFDLLKTNELRIDKGQVTGGLNLTDSEGNASVNVNLKLRKGEKQSFRVVGDVENLDLAHYGVLPADSVYLTSILNVRLKGDSLDNYEGRLKFFEIHLDRLNGDSIVLHDVVLKSKKPDSSRHKIDLNSSIANMTLQGQFKLKDAASFTTQLGQELNLYLRNNDSLINSYYAAKVPFETGISLVDTLVTEAELNEVLAFFRVPLDFEPKTKLFLELSHGETDVLDLRMLSDSFSVANVGFHANDYYVNMNKLPMENVLLLQGDLTSKDFWPSPGIRIEDFGVRPEGDNKEMDIYIAGKQPEQNNLFQFDVRTLFLKNGEVHTTIQPQDSRIVLKGREWNFTKGNQIRRVSVLPTTKLVGYSGGKIDKFFFENLELYREAQEIKIDGVISQEVTDKLEVNLSNIRLATFTEIFNDHIPLEGRVSQAKIEAWNLMSEQPGIYAEGDIENFSYQAIDSIGIDFEAGWPFKKGPDYAGLTLNVDKEGQDSLRMGGYYRISKDELHFDAKPSSLQLAWLSPFTEGIVSDLEGRLGIDRISIRGTTTQPRLTGAAHLTDASLKVDFLNAVFRIGDNTLTFNEDELVIPGIMLRDTFGHSAQMQGKVKFESISDARIALRFDEIDNLLVMDTRKQHNPDFYGRILLDGDTARISGPVSDLLIEASVKTGKGSWLDIPLEDYTSASRLEFVNFLSGDTLEVEKEEEQVSGISMRMTINATPDAKVRLIFDEQVGDIIEARGEGAITMEITKEGTFRMLGTYIVTEGNYLFTAENIVNKKFVVRPGGRITWSGEPYDADLDIDAVYKVNADISDLIGGQTARVPVDIVMHMNGSLENPVIDLELLLDELKQQDVLGLASYFRGIQYDEQELNKQVVSLLLFGRFTGHASGYASSNPTGGVTSSISELISNQVNYWISQAFQDANLGLEVNTNQFQDVELAIRTTLFNDRVSVERNGTLISNQQRSFSLGDLSVQVKLLPLPDSTKTTAPNAGQLVLEIFNREDASLNSNLNITRGVGVFYKKDFDRIRDLFK